MAANGTYLDIYKLMTTTKLIPGLLFAFFTFSAYTRATGQSRPDTLYTIRMNQVDIHGQRKWANDTVRYHYNQMKYYVTTILPYLDAATQLFNEVNTKLSDDNLGRKERKAFIKNKEVEMRTRFEDKIDTLNVTQGTLLIKLIARQTGLNVYKMLNEFKNPLVALKWQTWARLNGINLNSRYAPEKEPDLEQIMESLNYPLPPFYKTGQDQDAQLTKNF